MIVSIHQPAYLPWLGYFHKILLSDVFVFLDIVQMEKSGFVNRNLVRTASGVQWLTVPLLIKGHMDKSIGEMRINQADPWKRKHLGTIEQAYQKRPHYSRHADDFRRFIEGAGESLSDFLFVMLRFFLDAAKMGEVKIVRASALEPEGSRAELLADICRKAGADTYLSGSMGKTYLDREPFEKAGVEVAFQEFRHPEYDQGYGDFAPNMGIIDALFNCGGDAIAPMLK